MSDALTPSSSPANHGLLTVYENGPKHAPVLIVLNSLGASRDMWSPQDAWMTKHFRVLYMEYPGHGGSTLSANTVTVEALAADAINAAHAYGAKRVSIVGISLGGMVALAAAAADKVGYIDTIVVAHARWYQTDTSRAQWNDRIQAVRTHGMQAISQGTVDRWLTANFAHTHPDERKRLIEMLEKTTPEGYAACAAAVRDVDFRDCVNDISCQAVLISGDHDVAAPPDEIDALAKAMGNKAHHRLNTAHLGNIENPQAFTALLEQYLYTPKI